MKQMAHKKQKNVSRSHNHLIIEGVASYLYKMSLKYPLSVGGDVTEHHMKLCQLFVNTFTGSNVGKLSARNLHMEYIVFIIIF